MEAVVAIKMKPRELDIVRHALVAQQLSYAKQSKAKKVSAASRQHAKQQGIEVTQLLEVLGPVKQSIVGFGGAA